MREEHPDSADEFEALYLEERRKVAERVFDLQPMNVRGSRPLQERQRRGGAILETIVRINGDGTRWFTEDLTCAARQGVAAVLVPKVEFISAAGNPAFDVTPARLVTGLITERGVTEASGAGLLKLYPERRT